MIHCKKFFEFFFNFFEISFPGIKKQANYELNDRELDRAKENLKKELKRKIKNEKRLSKRYLTYEPMGSSEIDAKTDFEFNSKTNKRKRE